VARPAPSGRKSPGVGPHAKGRRRQRIAAGRWPGPARPECEGGARRPIRGGGPPERPIGPDLGRGPGSAGMGPWVPMRPIASSPARTGRDPGRSAPEAARASPRPNQAARSTSQLQKIPDPCPIIKSATLRTEMRRSNSDVVSVAGPRRWPGSRGARRTPASIPSTSLPDRNRAVDWQEFDVMAGRHDRRRPGRPRSIRPSPSETPSESLARPPGKSILNPTRTGPAINRPPRPRVRPGRLRRNKPGRGTPSPDSRSGRRARPGSASGRGGRAGSRGRGGA